MNTIQYKTNLTKRYNKTIYIYIYIYDITTVKHVVPFQYYR